MPKLIIVTGFTSSGKSTYCKQFKNVIEFDKVFNYARATLNYDYIRGQFNDWKNEDTVVLDAYIWHLDPDLKKLKATFNGNISQIEVQHVYSALDTVAITTINRATANRGYIPYSTDYHDLIFHIAELVDNIDKICLSLKLNNHIDTLTYVYRNSSNNYEFYNDNSHMSTVIKGVGISNNSYLLNYIDKISGAPRYHTIEINDQVVRPGSEQCHITWNNILSTGIDFKDKKVCDIGSFNGYFSVKCKRAGASTVHGYDNNKPALKISKLVSLYNQADCEFKEVDVGKDTLFKEQYDIVIALNMLHHVKRVNGEEAFLKVLNDIFKNCTEAVFEINDNEVNDVTTYATNNSFILGKNLESHIKTTFGNRQVIYFKKNV